jgi:DNA/RNA-binding domain of Phe-tRNA-synthetase-like protein
MGVLRIPLPRVVVLALRIFRIVQHAPQTRCAAEELRKRVFNDLT